MTVLFLNVICVFSLNITADLFSDRIAPPNLALLLLKFTTEFPLKMMVPISD